MSYDETDSPQQTLTAGTTIAFILAPEGNASGDESFTGSGIVTGMSVNVSLDAITTRSVTFQGTGALTRGTVYNPNLCQLLIELKTHFETLKTITIEVEQWKDEHGNASIFYSEPLTLKKKTLSLKSLITFKT